MAGRAGRPGAAAGCAQTPYDNDDIRCFGVRRVDIALGGGADHFLMQTVEDPKVPIRISGGTAPTTSHVVTQPGDIAVDGGPGADTITGSARVSGGPGDDKISLSSVHATRRALSSTAVPATTGSRSPRISRQNAADRRRGHLSADPARHREIPARGRPFRRRTDDVQHVRKAQTADRIVPGGRAGDRHGDLPTQGGAVWQPGRVPRRRTPTGSRDPVGAAEPPPSAGEARSQRARCTATVTGTDDEGEPIGPVGPWAYFGLTR